MTPLPKAPGHQVTHVGRGQTVIKVPSRATLKKYGLDAESWLIILEAQGYACAICRKAPKTGRFVTDHHHAKGWKKMKPAKRRLYVRGLTCWWCNKTYLGRSITEAKATQVLLYLRAFAARGLPGVTTEEAPRCCAARGNATIHGGVTHGEAK